MSTIMNWQCHITNVHYKFWACGIQCQLKVETSCKYELENPRIHKSHIKQQFLVKDNGGTKDWDAKKRKWRRKRKT
jgi:hypothetical protein